MKDEKIIELFFARDENAIKETEKKYGDLCRYVAGNILALREDVEECISDVMLKIWQSIPPDRPDDLAAYIGVSVRNSALNRSRSINAWKRGGQVQIVGEEFLSLMDDGSDLASDYESRRAGMIIDSFLESMKKNDKKIFVMRYWFDLTIEQISEQTGFGKSKIKMSLMRSRNRLAEKLRKEGIII